MAIEYGLHSMDGNPVHLKNVCVDVTVSGFVAHIQSDLHYDNQEDVAIETTFTFPLDDGAAVYRLEAEIEGRHIIAECQEKQLAKQTYDDAVASGQTAMHLAQHDKTSDIFTCTLGNLPAKTAAKLTLSYVLELPQEADGKLRFTLPTVLNPRYDPASGGLTVAERTRSKYVPDSDTPYTFTVTATVTGKLEIRSVTSVKDQLSVEYSLDRLEAQVSAVEDFQFDHDLSFLVEYEDTHKPQVILEKGDPEKEGFMRSDVLMVNFYPEIDKDAQTSCGEYIFVIDRSGSMGFGTTKMTHAKDALLLFLKSLPVGCYFNIVSFGSIFSSLFDSGSKEYTEDTLNEALALQMGMAADMGGTEILRPLQHVYSQPCIDGHPRQIFLLTDGEVWNVDEVIGITKRNAHNTRVFALGIGEGASTTLINGVARAGRGKTEFIADSEKMQPKVMSLLKCAMQPSITSLDVSWKLPAGVSAVTMPVVPPALFGGDRLILYALLQGTAKRPTSSYAVSIKGKTDKGAVNTNVYFDLDRVDSPHGHAPLHRLAAKAQIKELQDTEDENKGSATNTTKEKIIQMSTASNMVSRHTSFVAIDRDGEKRVVGAAMPCDIPVPTMGAMFQRPLLALGKTKKRAVGKRSSKKQKSADITVRTLTGQTVSCTTLNGQSTIEELKAHIQDVQGTPPDQQRLIIDGKQAEDGRELADYGDTTNMTFHLVLRLRGGGAGPIDQPELTPEEEEKARQEAEQERQKWEQERQKREQAQREKQEEEQRQYKERMMGDKLMAIVSMQTFRGSWELSTDVCALLGVDMEKVKKEAMYKDMVLVATLLVVAWLNEKWCSRKDEWEMIAGKAIGWIKSRDLEGNSLDLCLEEARKLLIGTDTV